MAFFKVQTIKTNVLGAINMRGLAKRLKYRIFPMVRLQS